MAITFITVNDERFPIPTHSHDLWNQPKDKRTRPINADLFHILVIEDTLRDEQDRPIFELSEKVAVNYAALVANEQPRAHRNPILTAYKKFIDANPAHFLRMDELGDPHNKHSKDLSLLHGQWVVFEQPKPEFVQPRLSAMVNQAKQIYLPGRTFASLADLDELHKGYAAMYHAPRFGGAYNIQALFQEADIEVARKRGLPLANLNRPVLRHIDASTFGLTDKGLVIRDNTGKLHVVPGTIMRDSGIVHVMQFGLVHINDKKSHVGFLADLHRGSAPITLSPSELTANGQNYSKQIYALANALHESGAWQFGPRAFAKRMTRWAMGRVKRALRPSNGD